MNRTFTKAIFVLTICVVFAGCSGKNAASQPTVPDGFKELTTIWMSDGDDGEHEFTVYAQDENLEPGKKFGEWFGSGEFVAWWVSMQHYNDKSEAGKNAMGGGESIKKHFGTWDSMAQAESLGGGVCYQPFLSPDGKMWIAVFEPKGKLIYGVRFP